MFFSRYSESLWSVAETFVYPLLLLILTPVLLKTVGPADYGLWVLAYSIAGFGNLANFGMGLATQRFVARARGEKSKSASMEQAAAVVAQTLLLAAIGGTVLAVVLLLAARPLAEIFLGKMGVQAHVILSIQVAGVVIACQQIESVLASGLRGLERFDLAAKAEATTKSLGAAAVIATAVWSRDVEAVLIVAATFAVAAVIAKGIVLRRALKRVIPVFSWRFPDRALLRFGLWTWLQGISATVFQQADRLLLSAMLGGVAVANYSVASQVGALVHAGFSATFAVVLPRLSRQMATGDRNSRAQHFSQTWRSFLALNVTAVIAVGLPLWIFGPALLHLWLGETATADVLRIYPLVLAAFLILSMNIAPHFVLLGSGSARYVSLTNGAAALLAIVALYPAVSIFGVEGAALCRVLYGIVVITSYLCYRTVP